MVLLSLPPVCFTVTWEFRLIQVGKKLRKSWHEEPPLHDALIMDAPAFWRTTLNIAASLKKRATSLVTNLHVQLCVQGQKKKERKKGKRKDEAGALRKTYNVAISQLKNELRNRCLCTTQQWDLDFQTSTQALPVLWLKIRRGVVFGGSTVVEMAWERGHGHWDRAQMQVSAMCTLWIAMLSCCYGFA